ncbi:pancreatic progenitor cell differentiation and proliferation factor-like [Zalophus californianus]|uniref:Pancreatic progenitor cell differentiation and proliferation factor-like n=1 Tax=Zalophus californianus TaxID=9704 RepID=A0A6J2DNV3_ZALCA|nr:pancreatic progenitor cell differentiation and proliferation factor-like [Zalophus californianus]
MQARRFELTHTRDSIAAIPSSGSLVATHDYHQPGLGSTSSNSSCRGAEHPGEAIPHHPASFPKSPLSRTRLQSWSPQNARNLPRPPAARSPVTWLWKP